MINLKSDRMPVFLPLEDSFVDVIAKAQRGLFLDDATLADRSGVSVGEIASLKKGILEEIALRSRPLKKCQPVFS